MWVYAVDAKASVEALPAAHGLRKRVPLRWYARAVREALAAGRKSAHARRAPHMFDTGAAGEALATFAADHAPGDAAIRPDASDWEIVEKARRIAADVQLAMHGIEIGDALVVARSRCDLYGVAMPAADDGDGQVARVRCELWWRRRLRTQHGRNAEASSVRLGLVHYGGDPYASREAVARRMGQNARNRLMLESVVVENDEGYRATLAELADKGTANKAIRRGELMTRLRGCEDLAVDAGFDAVMFTLTCPSRFHAVRQLGQQVKCIPNKRYDPTLTARDGQAYLRRVWARIRAELARLGVRYFGMRVAEPHHDATPHWHGLAFSSDIAAFERVMRKHGLRDSGDERGAQERRVKFERIDRARGSAVGYIAKYIAKNVDGAHVGDHKTREGFTVAPDLLGDLEITPSQRVETWAATWGIRQFQQFGGAPVGVWRELRRVKEEDLPREDESMAVRDAWAAAQKTAERPADWAAYCRAMGGVAGEARAVCVKRVPTIREGRYGAVRVLVPHGVAARGIATIDEGGIVGLLSRETEIFVPSTRYEWRVVSRSGAAASTRTCVNNCTGGGDVQGGRGVGDGRGGELSPAAGGKGGGAGAAPHVRRAVGA
ncbi:MAG: replication endonuclease [Burkholderia sp.]|jgi:hypothetical protein|uniref:replication endonuclease n=2 Tax=Burkholderia sp. TaxID=36773 RepID=UPI00258CAD35|nr:replication endonuclease [Burkholderia sp.]MCA3780130.1 replication endonuclease [Burkholderia sp.]MCA3796258.1 replication endonuclease [Burkholderia sp.]MCA3802907.1 replication endonuclease [Burkholderia sp.]MCA3810858.1 replication endonuclease [Burkholderia sp.]MCA3818928.1 replication endonuclease [Burkholderia sp.]